jgi:HAD superfamily hydrolase (TIGR01509 family)
MDVPVLLIEFEGVLANTAALRAAALTEALAVDGIDATAVLLRQAAGRSTEDAVRAIRDAVGAEDDPTAVELCRLRAERAFAARAGKGLSLQKGVKEALEKLSTCGRLAIVTRASRREVEFVLNLAGLEALFRPVIALEDATPGKPARAPYDAAMKRVADLFPGQVLRGLAVEDSVIGVRAARAAGFVSVIVGKVQPQDAMEADCWVESLSDLTPERVRSLVSYDTKKGTR